MKVFATVTGDGRNAGCTKGGHMPLPVIANQNASIAANNASPSQRSRRAVPRAGGKSSVRVWAESTSDTSQLPQVNMDSRFRGNDGIWDRGCAKGRLIDEGRRPRGSADPLEFDLWY